MLIEHSICAVVPVYNAEATLERLVGELTRVLGCFQSYRIVLVDDCSTDESYRLIKTLCRADENIIGIRLKKNSGQQTAVFCGLEHAAKDYTVIIDDDLEQDPADIMALYTEAQKGYDAVYGISVAGTKGAFRAVGSKLRDTLFDCMTDKPKDIKVGSFRLINKQTVDKIVHAQTRFVYVSMELLKHTSRIGNVAVRQQPAVTSTYKPGKLIKLLVQMVVYYAPGRFWRLFRKQGRCYSIDELVKGN